MLDSIAIWVGLTAQGLFSIRMLLQWLATEKAGKIVVNASFWWVSLVSALLMMIYALLRADPIILIGQIICYAIHIRNLQLMTVWSQIPSSMRRVFYFCPLVGVPLILYETSSRLSYLVALHNYSPALFLLGGTAQILFLLRFVHQWYIAEQGKASVLPLGFWICSLAGSALFIIYAVVRKDIVLLVGHGSGSLIYLRNLSIGLRPRRLGEWHD